jgi:hypothetical protein
MFEPETPALTENAATQVLTPAVEYPFRLLPDEVVLGSYPITQQKRWLGKVASFLFVTDARVIYSAEAKALGSSSTQHREYEVSTVKGLEAGRKSGLEALGVTALLGVALNFIGLLILAGITGAAAAGGGDDYGYGYGYGNPLEFLGGFSAFFVFLAVASLVVGVVVFFVFRRSTASLSVVGPLQPRPLASESDIPKLLVTILLFLIFGIFIGLVVVVWNLVREAGYITADDAQLFADPNNIDRVAHEAGALIIDVQARGKLAGK